MSFTPPRKSYTSTIVATVVGLLAAVGALMYVLPEYSVWAAKKTGEAHLAESVNSKRVKIQEAEAQFESSQYLAKSEVERAKGAAEANKIIGASLQGNDMYLRYLWIQSLGEKEGRDKEVIYIPTEANLPILEATRLPSPARKQ